MYMKHGTREETEGTEKQVRAGMPFQVQVAGEEKVPRKREKKKEMMGTGKLGGCVW